MTQVVLETNHGNITLALNSAAAPKTVENFIRYVNDGFYNNTIFHRVINGFMIQGGGFDTNMEQKPTQKPIKNEANNDLTNEIGSIAMARTSDPHSATAQFFINVNDNHFLNFKEESTHGFGYCVFGKVVEGMDIVNHIKEVETGNHGMHQDVPLDAIVITSAKVKND